MKNLIFILLAVFALGCGDGNKNSTGSGTNDESEQNIPIAPESGDGSIHSDTTTTGGNNSQNQYDSLK